MYVHMYIFKLTWINVATCIVKFYIHSYSTCFDLDFLEPNVTLTCSNNTINVKWNVVHKYYDSIDEMVQNYQELFGCSAEISCDSGYEMQVHSYIYL